MKMTKVREFVAAVVALIAVFILFVGIAIVAGWDIPGIQAIANFLGIER